MNFNPYEFRNDTEALKAAEERIAELEKELITSKFFREELDRLTKGKILKLSQENAELRKLAQAVVDAEWPDITPAIGVLGQYLEMTK